MKIDTEGDPQQSLTQMLTWLSDCCKGNMARHADDRWYYRGGPADFLLQHGTFYEPRVLPKRYRRGPIKACFYNSAMYALNNMSKGVRYVEGYAASIIPVHHAWCIDKDGKLLELTWDTPGTAYFGIEFKPGIALTKGSVLFNERYFKLYQKPWRNGGGKTRRELSRMSNS